MAYQAEDRDLLEEKVGRAQAAAASAAATAAACTSRQIKGHASLQIWQPNEHDKYMTNAIQISTQ